MDNFIFECSSLCCFYHANSFLFSLQKYRGRSVSFRFFHGNFQVFWLTENNRVRWPWGVIFIAVCNSIDLLFCFFFYHRYFGIKVAVIHQNRHTHQHQPISQPISPFLRNKNNIKVCFFFYNKMFIFFIHLFELMVFYIFNWSES